MIFMGVIPVTIDCSCKKSSKEYNMYLKPTGMILSLMYG